MELDCLRGDWGLPSVDNKCLNIMAYAQFVGAPIKINRNKKLWRNLRAQFPVFRSAQGIVEKSDRLVIQQLKDQNFNADAALSDQQRADILAYSALVDEKLLPAVLYTWWIDAKNHVELTRPWYAKALHFPFNYFIPGQWQREAEGRVECTKGGKHMLPSEVAFKVLKEGKECLDLLSAKLGSSQFFFGSEPSSLDSLVFSYLAPILRAPFPNSALQQHLKQCENLWMFCSRILQRYFPPDPEEEVELQRNSSKEEKPKDETMDSFEDSHKHRNQVLAVLFAITSLVSYALLSGLVQLELYRDEGEIEDFEGEESE